VPRLRCRRRSISASTSRKVPRNSTIVLTPRRYSGLSRVAWSRRRVPMAEPNAPFGNLPQNGGRSERCRSRRRGASPSMRECFPKNALGATVQLSHCETPRHPTSFSARAVCVRLDHQGVLAQ
jgi:hypothetical protein